MMSIVAVDGAAVYRPSPICDASAAHARHRVREGKDYRVVAVRAAAAAFNTVPSHHWQINIKRTSAAVDFPRHGANQLHRHLERPSVAHVAARTVLQPAKNDDGPARWIAGHCC